MIRVKVNFWLNLLLIFLVIIVYGWLFESWKTVDFNKKFLLSAVYDAVEDHF